MRLPKEAYQMQQTIGTHLPHLSQAQLAGLVLWVCGAILAGSACHNCQGRQRPGPSLPDGTGRKSLLRAVAPVGAGLVVFR